MPPTQSIIRTAIRAELDRRVWRIAELARLAAKHHVCSQATVFKWLADDISSHRISVDTAEALARVLELDVRVE